MIGYIDNSLNRKYYKGFTLAETLITLVIIGVVAALTIPNIIVQHQKEETVTRLKKFYSTINQAMNKATVDHGPLQNWKVEDGKANKFVETYMIPYLNVVKNCGYETTGDCRFEWANLNEPATKNVYDDTYYKIILADGSALFVTVNQYDSRKVKDGVVVYIPRAFASVYVDINGHKGPNVYGKDLFVFIYWVQNDYSVVGDINTTGQFLPNAGTIASSIGKTREDFKTNKCNKNGNGQTCAALIMADDWQIKDDYPW